MEQKQCGFAAATPDKALTPDNTAAPTAG
jgi:hypothetical protein